jgi:xanthine dehydrogenase YagS FAD-binding subunit
MMEGTPISASLSITIPIMKYFVSGSMTRRDMNVGKFRPAAIGDIDLVALDAVVEIAGAGTAKRAVKLEDFLLPPEVNLHRENDLKSGELVTAIVLPRQTGQSVHLKQGETDSFDWPIADVAVALDLAADDTCRRAAVVLGTAAPVPHRVKSAETLLTGKTIENNAAHAAAEAAVRGAVPLSNNAYKVPIFEALVERAILSVARAG